MYIALSTCTSLLGLMLFLGIPAVGSDPGLGAAIRRVRPIHSRAQALLKEGAERSTRFRNLIEALERSDVIVYVTLSRLPAWVAGRLQFMGVGVDVRYLLITLRVPLYDDEAISILGHELQHAVEVAKTPGVRSASAFNALYKRIGIQVGKDDAYDTRAAQETGDQVRRELASGQWSDRACKNSGATKAGDPISC